MSGQRRRCSLIVAFAFAGWLSHVVDALPVSEPTPVRATVGGRTVTAYLGDSCLTEPAGEDLVVERCVDKRALQQPPSPRLGVRRGGSVIVRTGERTRYVRVWPGYIDRTSTRIVGHVRQAQPRDQARTRFSLPLGKLNPRSNALLIQVFVDRGRFEAVVGITVQR